MVYSQSSRNALTGSLRSPSQAIHHTRPRLPITGLTHQRIKHHTAVAFHRPCAFILKESYPPTPFPFSVTAHHAKHQSQRQYLPLPPRPIGHRRRRIDIKAPKRANGMLPHQIPHLGHKTLNKAATIKKRGITEHQTPMHNSIHRCIQKSIHRCIEKSIYNSKRRCIEKSIHKYRYRCIQTPMYAKVHAIPNVDA